MLILYAAPWLPEKSRNISSVLLSNRRKIRLAPYYPGLTLNMSYQFLTNADQRKVYHFKNEYSSNLGRTVVKICVSISKFRCLMSE